MIKGIISPLPSCCSAYILSGLYSGSTNETAVKPGPFPQNGYLDNNVLAITMRGQERLHDDLEASGFVPVCQFESRYDRALLTLWVKPKNNHINILGSLRKGKKAA